MDIRNLPAPFPVTNALLRFFTLVTLTIILLAFTPKALAQTSLAVTASDAVAANPNPWHAANVLCELKANEEGHLVLVAQLTSRTQGGAPITISGQVALTLATGAPVPDGYAQLKPPHWVQVLNKSAVFATSPYPLGDTLAPGQLNTEAGRAVGECALSARNIDIRLPKWAVSN